MTEKEKQEKVDSFKSELEEVKKHRRPSGQEDNLAIETVQIKQRQEPTLDVYSNNEVVIQGAKDGVIKAKDAEKSENKKRESERN